MTLPNLITLGRILLVPLVFWLLATDRVQLACVVFLIAGLSDALDGYLAKRWNMTSRLGAYLDPLADKLLIVSVFVALTVTGAFPLWLVTLVVTRDVLIVAAVVLCWILSHPMAIRPLMISKATTAAQISLAALVLANRGFDLQLDPWVQGVVWLTGALTAASLFAYMRAWLRHMSQPIAVPPRTRETSQTPVSSARDRKPSVSVWPK